MHAEEKLSKPSLEAAIWKDGDLSVRQYGFRSGGFSVHAVREIGHTIKVVQSGNHYSRKVIILATLDVKNAFNSAWWTDMIQALKKFNLPEYLQLSKST